MGKFLLDIIYLPFLLIGCLIARPRKKPIDVGLGPEPLINNIYHKQAMELFGYSAETWVTKINHLTDCFDYRGDLRLPPIWRICRSAAFFLRTVFKYRIAYIYFNGGPLKGRPLLSVLEPFLFRLARTRVVVMPYGSDVQEMTRCPHLPFVNAMALDYPQVRFRRKKVATQIDRWTCHANHVISGCDWVDYMYHWDTLMLGHFSIDTESWKPRGAQSDNNDGRPLRLLHAPNHRRIKGSEHFTDAVEELRAEGVAIELQVIEKVTNDEVKAAMAQADVICDQLIIGWYAMFAIEAMAMGKPVVCFLRPDLKQLYVGAGLIEADEVPIVEASVHTVKDALRALALADRSELADIGQKSRAFVEKHHSVAAIGQVFVRINKSIGVLPSREAAADRSKTSGAVETGAVVRS